MDQTYIKAIVFDFDGLIIDTELPSFLVWQRIYKEHGAILEKDLWVSCVGANYDVWHPCAHLETLTGTKVIYEELINRKNELKAETCDKLPLLPGVLDKLEEAKALGLKLAIASSSPLFWIEHHTKRLDIAHYFDCFAAGSEVERTKPSPDVYLLAAKRLGVDPKTCLVFEDSKNGIIAAKAAGMHAIGVPNEITANLDFSLALARLNSLEDKTLKELMQLVPPS